MRFEELASVSAAVARTPGRNAKIDLLADALRRLGPDELSPGASYLSGELRQRQTGVGYAALRDLPPPAETASLSVTDVDEAFAAMSQLAGKGSQAARRALVATLFGAATEPERHFLIRLL